MTLPWLEKEIHFLLPLALILGALAIWGNQKKKIYVILLLFSLGLSHGINKGIKKMVKRTRPHYALKKGEFHLHEFHLVDAPKEDEYSFPSGHTAFFFALAGFTALFFRHLGLSLGLYLLAFIVGFSRIYIGVHYPFDVLGGMVVGTMGAGLGYGMGCYILRKKGLADICRPDKSENILQGNREKG
ncbi:MAG: phosphatase PAP2 family protein [Planctomycetota bacterium]|nr:MAG: phosphatase PAP2 family protein [Planctomycetota bacterium]